MKTFLSGDWGTSSFRLRLIDGLTVVAEEVSDLGIRTIYNQYERSDGNRLEFYLAVLQQHIDKLAASTKKTVSGLPVLLSGMASSSVGMHELPYGELPFSLDGRGLNAKFFEPSPDFHHPLLLISGIKSENDVMRGEETQLLGLMAEILPPSGKTRFIFPGTHSKHIWVEKDQVVGFKTYMTGEIFELLSKKSILSSGVDYDPEIQMETFEQGVTDSKGTDLLEAAFHVRTNHLFGKMDPVQNYYYLSGLLIGTELKNIRGTEPVCLCSESRLQRLYLQALQVLQGDRKVHMISGRVIDEAVVWGQLKVYEHFKQNF